MPQVLNNKLQILKLQEEIKLLRSFVIGIAGKDKEGEYKTEFVRKILRFTREKPKHTFKDKKSFLAHFQKSL